MKPIFPFLVCGSLFLAGCVPPDDHPRSLPVVPDNPFGKLTAPVDTANLKKTTDSDLAARVDFLGRQLRAGNPQLKLPDTFSFFTIARPSLEIFHLDERAIYVTEGLVKRCRPNTDDLAAILAQELGNISAQHLAAASVAELHDFDRGPPPTVTVGNDRQNDMTNYAQALKYENARQARQAPPPSPRLQAQTILANAGYPRTALDAVTPLLEEADRNCALERHVIGLPQNNGWGP